ncbi:S9 family peptidase [Sphingomonas sp. CGMCC 1.13654]|uniref:S9 family peptidase n=1 Tax=Sphingomonas chungangi TaxID=2683589 RepID=A0A838LAU6_9SPHN|nr:S9 family peptidase [Sphingomonas chungangi]MVW55370.1 prolyl oligopeptidase family serine peptidase [Sphingomonas chungangi]
MAPALAFLLASAAPLAAQPLHQFTGLVIAPAGDRVASVESAQEPDALVASHGAIVVRGASDGHVLARIDPCKVCDYSALAYGPDGQLVFVARDRRAGTATLMLLSGRDARRLATVNGLAADTRWSPDGRSIALLVTIGAQKETGAVQAGTRQVGEIGEANDEKRIAVVPASGGTLRTISPPDRFVYEFDWTPDGKGFVATTAKGNGDVNWWVATIDAIDAATGAVRTITAPAAQANFPRISPDGQTVAFIGGLMSDFGSVGGDIWTVPFAGGVAKDVTPGYRGTFTSLQWDKGGGGIRTTALLGDQAAVVPVDPAGGAGEPLWTARAKVDAEGGGAAFAKAGTMAMVAQDYEHAPEIFAGPVATPVQITTDNGAYRPIVSARSITWKSGGHDVQGWLLAPRGAVATTGRAPMITVVHGGPAAAVTPEFLWKGDDAALIAAGYWLFYPNPRGSYGQGEAFVAANKRDFGGGDLKDILAGIDAAERVAPIDDARLGLKGHSYGGFMAMWANTQTDRFKAIHAGAGISDWISYYGTNGINTWMIPYFGKSLYEDSKPYWDISAIQFIDRAKTPTLITVGERDIEVPPSQSLEYWNGLKTHGVPTSLVIYPDEGHGFHDPAHVADERQRVVEWFDRYLRGR